ncbi:arylsulfatase B-like [Dysidea avara]|uniref:arylsulfatase B-like n=1 Tax=Dysidea avara TaxID=196820 RepID=UPI0033334492
MLNLVRALSRVNVAVFFVVASLSAQWSLSIAATKPNILMIVIDDLGWNDTSYKGSDIKTDFIDTLAVEGIRLQQYYVQRYCSPTRSAILAGRYPYHMGLARAVIINGHPFGLPLNQTTIQSATAIADELKKGGYSTHCVGKWDLGMHKWEYTPTYRGFDTFFGYYNAVEDYYDHSFGNVGKIKFDGVDFRNNTKPVTDKNGTYSTMLFTEAVEQIIMNHNSDKGPFFIYAAYQSIHYPMEAPQKYIDECSYIPYDNRRILCGMLRAADEGIANITARLKERNFLDDTIIIFTTDNGGQTMLGSSNLPLRGNKMTVFEGGVRGNAFVWGSKLPKLNYDNHQLIHATDWLPTIVEGIAGLELDKDKWALDGYNVWKTITNNDETPRKEVLINLDPPTKGFRGQAAIRVGQWKLVTGLPNCSMTPLPGGHACPDGWIHLNGTIEPPPYTPSFTWLFNIEDDPNERNNVADQHPEMVKQLKERIEFYNSTHIEQLHPGLDPKSNPAKFGGVWTPWLD